MTPNVGFSLIADAPRRTGGSVQLQTCSGGYSITSSAATSGLSGTVRPSILAVWACRSSCFALQRRRFRTWRKPHRYPSSRPIRRSAGSLFTTSLGRRRAGPVRCCRIQRTLASPMRSSAGPAGYGVISGHPCRYTAAPQGLATVPIVLVSAWGAARIIETPG
jgi:hypothetical protein